MLLGAAAATAQAAGWVALAGSAQGRDGAAAAGTAGAHSPHHVSDRPRPRPDAKIAAAPRRHRWAAPIRSIDDVLQHEPHIALPRRAIMLTIDDGPDPVWTPKYLRLLARYDVPATFCMIGRQVAAHRRLARAVAAHGHVVANHTWTHDEALETRPRADIATEIDRTSAAIHAATGQAPTLYRAPGGVWGPRVLAELDRRRLAPLGWDVDPRDWSLPGAAAIESTMLTARRHDIVLCHDGGGDRSQTYAALKRVIPTLLARGYHFVTLPPLG